MQFAKFDWCVARHAFCLYSLSSSELVWRCIKIHNVLASSWKFALELFKLWRCVTDLKMQYTHFYSLVIHTKSFVITSAVNSSIVKSNWRWSKPIWYYKLFDVSVLTTGTNNWFFFSQISCCFLPLFLDNISKNLTPYTKEV